MRQLDDMLLDAFTVLDTLQKRAEAAMRRHLVEHHGRNRDD